MCLKSWQWRILILILIQFIALADLGLGSPTTTIKDDNVIESLEEINDLNKNNSILKDSATGKAIEPRFVHRDEDMLAELKQSTILASLKSDVEILESNEDNKEDTEIEERFRGPAINLNTENFINENIEVNANSADLEEKVSTDAASTSHLILSILLVLVALVVIGLYVGFVVWRRHIEQRYGTRELLVSSDNQDYWPQDVIASVVAQHQQQYQQQLRS